MAIVISTINVNVYIEIQENFLISSIEFFFFFFFDDDEVNFLDDNASCYRAKWGKFFFFLGKAEKTNEMTS